MNNIIDTVDTENTKHFIEVTQKYLSFEKFEEFIQIFNTDIEIRTSYINMFFGFKNMKPYKPESIKSVKLEIENKDFKTKTYNCSLFTGKEYIRAIYNFISGQCVTTFEKDIEEIKFLSIPNQNTRFLYNTLATSSNLDLFKTRATKTVKEKLFIKLITHTMQKLFYKRQEMRK